MPGPVRQYINLMLVFLASGLWHAGLGYGVGWTFLVWGALNGAYQWVGVATRPVWSASGRRLPRVAAGTPWLVLRVLLTFHLIAITWVFFRAKSVGDAWLILTRDRQRPRRDAGPDRAATRSPPITIIGAVLIAVPARHRDRR